MVATVWAAPLPISEDLFTQPEAIGPFVDLQTAKLAGEAPYVIRDAVTGNIYDRIRNDVYPSSEDYARCGGHQSYVDVPQPKVKARLTGCWKCGKIYDLETMRSYASAAAFASENGFSLDPAQIHINTAKGCTHELARDRRTGDCWKPAKIRQSEIAAAFDAFKSDQIEAEDLEDSARAFLLQHVSDEAAEDYLLANPPALSFRRTGKAFAASLKKDCLAYLAETGRNDYAPLVPNLGADRKQKERRLAELQEQYRTAPTEERIALEGTLQAAILSFATRIARGLMLSDKRETAIAHDDVAQESTIGLILKNSNLGTVSENNIREAVQAERKRTKDLASEKRSRSSLDLLIENKEDGSLDDNPLIYLAQKFRDFGPELPDWIQGTDRDIIELAQEGNEFPEIAQMLGLSSDALKQRVSRLKKRAKEHQK